MRKIVSLILICVFMTTAVAFANDSAVTENSNAEELQAYKIMQGDTDGNLRLSDSLTRAEAATLIVRLYGFTPENSEAAPANIFSDMENHWACNAVMIAQGLRLTDKTDGEAFNPDENITSGDFIKMIICLLGYKEVAEQRGQAPVGYFIQASQLGVTNGINLTMEQSITRGQAAKLLSNSLDIPIMEMTSFSKDEDNRYTILNGKNGVEFRSLRTMLENK